MILARVVGRSWATVKHEAYRGLVVFGVEPIDWAGVPVGPSFLAVDTVGACPGERVLVMREGSGARQVLGGADQPFHSVVVGIVDAVDVSDDPAPPAAGEPR